LGKTAKKKNPERFPCGKKHKGGRPVGGGEQQKTSKGRRNLGGGEMWGEWGKKTGPQPGENFV